MRLLFSFIALVFWLSVCASPAAAAPCDPTNALCRGADCETLGRTTMDFNQENIIACMKDGTTGTLKWKSMTGGGETSMIGAEDGYAGQTGTAACASMGKTCTRVFSANYIWNNIDCPGALHCIRVCDTWYNTGLAGVAQGSDNDNIHDCSALLGQQTTYYHAGVVECRAFFSAVCN